MNNHRFCHTFVQLFVIVVLTFCAAGCKYHYIEKPERLLSHDEMVDIICEMAYINAVYDRGGFTTDSTLSKIGRNAFYERLYRKYGINREILEQNNTYYYEYSKEYMSIYKDAMDRIKAMENDELEGQRRAEEAIEAAARAKIKAQEDSVRSKEVEDSLILAREDSTMAAHRKGKNEEEETPQTEEIPTWGHY
ncbi:MAG: DUF4296 domain-containing protein [Flavobacteriales bacterium]|nr:DUF4296 domain-containing protein [Flavobacteriales bacterium]